VRSGITVAIPNLSIGATRPAGADRGVDITRSAHLHEALLGDEERRQLAATIEELW
jgi:hypothetical protein